MILSEGNDLGSIIKEGEKYIITIQNESFSLSKEEWIDLVNISLTEFPHYLKTEHPDITRAIRPREGIWMGELYELIQKAATKEDQLKKSQ